MAKLIRIDRNGTEYWGEAACPKCGGSGWIDCYYRVEGGRCFKCGGTGHYYHEWKVYTPEYRDKLEARRLAKAKKTAPARNQKLFNKWGLSPEGKAWIVTGDTYTIKDQLKAAGARFNSLGWHFDHEVTDYPVHEISINDIGIETPDGSYMLLADGDLMNLTKKLREQYAPQTCESDFIGSIGDKLDLTVKYLGYSTYVTHFTYYGEDHYVYKFEDQNGNLIIWDTGSPKQLDEGNTYQLKGSVKEHKKYKGNKQTVLTRCKVRTA